MAIRWATPPRKFDPTKWARNVLIEELGQLAADEARPIDSPPWPGAILYTEPQPPGRDVFLARSAISDRTVELVHNVAAGEISQMDSLRLSLADSNEGLDWSVFDLSFRTPAGWRLESHSLNAGDLKMNFTSGGNRMSLREIGVAHLALKRMPLDRWLADHCRQPAVTQPISISTPDGGGLEGLSSTIQKRKSFFKKQPDETTAMIFHDPSRDKLFIIDGNDPDATRDLATTVGWASHE